MMKRPWGNSIGDVMLGKEINLRDLGYKISDFVVGIRISSVLVGEGWRWLIWG